MTNSNRRIVAAIVLGLTAVAANSTRGATAPPAEASAAPRRETLVWTLDGAKSVGGYVPLVLGAPAVADGGHGLRFGGAGDGLIVPVDPIAALAEFTIEALIAPEAGGPEAQRFLHIEDERGNRTLMEIRMEADGRWCLDTFLLCGGNRLTLLDRSRLHPPGQWHWVALRCGGGRMDSFVDGVAELSGAVAMTPFAAGRISLGVRLTREYWFRGAIREVRFHPTALSADQLQRQP